MYRDVLCGENEMIKNKKSGGVGAYRVNLKSGHVLKLKTFS